MVCESNCKKKVKTFYWYFRPIALIAKLFGVLPLQNLHHSNGSKIYFSYISVAHVYSTIVFVCVLFSFFFFTKFQFGFDIKDQTEFWKVVVAYVMITRSIVCFIFCVHHSKKLPGLIKMLELFDRKKCCMLKIKENGFKKFCTRSFLPLFNGSFYLFIFFVEVNLFVRQLLPEDVKNSEAANTAAIIFGILGIWQVLPLLLYIYFAYVIKWNFIDINQTIASHVSIENIDNKNIQYDSNLSNVIEDVRCLHTLMSAAVNQLSNSYGSFMAVDQLCVNIMFVINFFVYFMRASDDFHLLICTIINAILVIAVIMVSHKVKDYVSKVDLS